VDRDHLSRPLAERLLIGLALILAFSGLAGGAWWLWTETSVGALVRDSSPSWTPDGEVIFTSETDGKGDIYETDRAGSRRRSLVSTSGDDGGAALSLDGSKLAYHSNVDGNYEIYAAGADGSGPSNLTHDPATDQMPAWSRDGTQIVFMSDRGGKTFDIYRMKADGSDVERLTNGKSNWFPEYSPDGGQLALHIERNVYIMSLSTKGLRQVTRDPDNGLHPTWSPTGHKLAFMSARNGRSEIFTSLVDGSEPHSIVTMPTGDAINPRWSPAGQYIALVHVPGGVANDADGKAQRVVYIVEVESGRVTRISR